MKRHNINLSKTINNVIRKNETYNNFPIICKGCYSILETSYDYHCHKLDNYLCYLKIKGK